MSSKLEIIVSTVLDWEVVTRAAKVALVVGTCLNLINQGDKIIGLAFGEISSLKLFLTYLVPYAVSTYTAICMSLPPRVLRQGE